MTPRLTLTVLADNTTLTDHDFTGEPGLSFFIETTGKKILFDTGLSGLFIANAEKKTEYAPDPSRAHPAARLPARAADSLAIPGPR